MQWTNIGNYHVPNAIARHFNAQDEGGQLPPNTPNSAHGAPITRRSGLKIAGAFLLVTALAGVGGAASLASNQETTKNSSGASSAAARHTTPISGSDAGATEAAAPSDSQGASDPDKSATSSSSTSVSASTNNGSTAVSVNGQSIDVPDNGTVRHVMSDDAGQQTSVEISHQQSAAGDTTNHSSTSVHISDSANSSSREEDATP